MINYETGIGESGIPWVWLNNEKNEHIGSIAGTIIPCLNDFERNNNIITIEYNGEVVAIVWNAIKLQDDVVEQVDCPNA